VTCSEIFSEAGITPESPYYDRVFNWMARRNFRFFTLETEEDLQTQVSRGRGQQLLSDAIKYISVLEVADGAPERPEEKQYGNWNVDPTKKRKPTAESAMPRFVEERNEASNATGFSEVAASLLAGNGKKMEEDTVYRLSDLLRDAGWEHKRLHGRLKTKKFLERRGVDTGDRNFVIPQEHILLIRLEFEEAKVAK